MMISTLYTKTIYNSNTYTLIYIYIEILSHIKKTVSKCNMSYIQNSGWTLISFCYIMSSWPQVMRKQNPINAKHPPLKGFE